MSFSYWDQHLFILHFQGFGQGQKCWPDSLYSRSGEYRGLSGNFRCYLLQTGDSHADLLCKPLTAANLHLLQKIIMCTLNWASYTRIWTGSGSGSQRSNSECTSWRTHRETTGRISIPWKSKLIIWRPGLKMWRSAIVETTCGSLVLVFSGTFLFSFGVFVFLLHNLLHQLMSLWYSVFATVFLLLCLVLSPLGPADLWWVVTSCTYLSQGHHVLL